MSTIMCKMNSELALLEVHASNISILELKIPELPFFFFFSLHLEFVEGISGYSNSGSLLGALLSKH